MAGSVAARFPSCGQGEHAYRDIEVPAGASRLDLVMTWDEPPADTISSTVLNDLDLWLDRNGDCGEGACGEQVSASRVDNVEWIILKNPRPGTYRAKVVARRVYTAPPRAALAWTVIRGGSTPNLLVDTDRTLLVGEEEQELTVTVTADQYVAAGSRLHVDCRDAGEASGCEQIRIHSMDVSREDGVSVDLSDDVDPPIPLGSSIPLGEIATGETQEVRFVISSPGAVGSDSPVLHGQRLERERGVCLGRSGLGRHRPIRDCSASCARRLRGGGRHQRRTRVPPVGSAAGDAGAGGAVVHAARRAARRFGLVPVDGAGQWSGPFRNPRAWGRGWPAQRSHRCLPRRSNLRIWSGSRPISGEQCFLPKRVRPIESA